MKIGEKKGIPLQPSQIQDISTSSILLEERNSSCWTQSNPDLSSTPQEVQSQVRNEMVGTESAKESPEAATPKEGEWTRKKA